MIVTFDIEQSGTDTLHWYAFRLKHTKVQYFTVVPAGHA